MGLSYNINMPWLTLDDWQKDYINTPPEQNCFLLTGRQVGKTAAMSIKAVEMCVRHFKTGQNILICSVTEKQAYRMLAKALAYAKVKHPGYLIQRGKDKPTMHKALFSSGAGIYCFAAGETGEGLRGDTIKKLMIDEGARMSEEFFISSIPMTSVSRGSIDVASTPNGKRHKDGTEKFFYKCSLDESFKKFYVSAEDCPRHDLEFLKKQKERMTKLAYAQEYLALFTDELQRLFSDELIKKICVLKRIPNNYKGKFYLGVDVAGFGEDACAYDILEKMADKRLEQRECLEDRRNYTIDTSKRIFQLNQIWQKLKKIGVDDGGIGFGVFSELMNDKRTIGKTEALNNSKRFIDEEEKDSVKLLKEAMYVNLLVLMEKGNIRLLDNREVMDSLASIQYDEGKIFGANSHHAEAIIRAAWVAEKDKSLNIWCR